MPAAFLPANAKVVSTDGRTEDAKKKFYATPEDYARNGGDDVLAMTPLSTASTHIHPDPTRTRKLLLRHNEHLVVPSRLAFLLLHGSKYPGIVSALLISAADVPKIKTHTAFGWATQVCILDENGKIER